jgi:septum formation protein
LQSQVILASTSVYRKKQLEQLCIAFRQEKPLIDEESLKDNSLSPQHLAEMLAQAKSHSLKHLFPKDIIIGSDQLVSFEGKIYGKSHTPEKACEHLQKLQGKTQELITSVSILSEHQNFLFTDVTRITLKKLNRKHKNRTSRNEPS